MVELAQLINQHKLTEILDRKLGFWKELLHREFEELKSLAIQHLIVVMDVFY